MIRVMKESRLKLMKVQVSTEIFIEPDTFKNKDHLHFQQVINYLFF